MRVVGVFGDLERGLAALERLRGWQFAARHLDLIGGGAAPAVVAEAAGVAASAQTGPEQSVAGAIFDGRLSPDRVEALERRLRDGGVLLLVTTGDEHRERQAPDALRGAGVRRKR